jgi:hypothetical protein
MPRNDSVPGLPSPPRRRAYRWRLAIAGGLLLACLGGLAGATGLCRTEYRASPWEQALMIGWSGGVYGLVGGLLAGLAVDAIRSLVHRRNGPRRPLGP